MLCMLLLLAACAAPASETELELKTGEVRTIHCVDIARIAIGDPRIVDTKRLSRGEMEITAVKAGKTTVLVWHSDGSRQSWEVTVREPIAPSKKESVSDRGERPLPEGELIPNADCGEPSTPAVAELWDQGIALFNAGKKMEAAEFFDRALALQPTLMKARLYRAIAYFGVGEVEKAAAEYATFRRSCPVEGEVNQLGDFPLPKGDPSPKRPDRWGDKP